MLGPSRRLKLLGAERSIAGAVAAAAAILECLVCGVQREFARD
jgi:hypothetical protein